MHTESVSNKCSSYELDIVCSMAKWWSRVKWIFWWQWHSEIDNFGCPSGNVCVAVWFFWLVEWMRPCHWFLCNNLEWSVELEESAKVPSKGENRDKSKKNNLLSIRDVSLPVVRESLVLLHGETETAFTAHRLLRCETCFLSKRLRRCNDHSFLPSEDSDGWRFFMHRQQSPDALCFWKTWCTHRLVMQSERK